MKLCSTQTLEPDQRKCIFTRNKEADLTMVEDLKINVFTSINEMKEQWDYFLNGRNQFLSSSYLSSMENCPPDGMEFVYAMIYKSEKLIGIAPFQIIKFNAGKSINFSEPKTSIQKVTHYFKTSFASKVALKGLVGGNILLTGDHTSVFQEEGISDVEKNKIYLQCVDYVHAFLEEHGRKMYATFLKDFETDCWFKPNENSSKPYHRFFTQPNMVFEIREEWNTFEDYLAALKSKYRVRYKRAVKKGSGLDRRLFSLEDIEEYEKKIFGLFQNVANNAEFSTFELHPSYFKELKIQLGEKYRLEGYFLEEKLVGFTTTIDNGHEIEAHYLGYDFKVNTPTLLYLNMLYNMIEYSIAQGVQKLVLSRTALEIKSSVGAKPENMYFYLRHQKTQTNKLLPMLLSYLTPNQDWEPRNPYK